MSRDQDGPDPSTVAARAEAATRCEHVLATARAVLAARDVLAAARWSRTPLGPDLAAAVERLGAALDEEERLAYAHQRAVLAVIEADRTERREAMGRHHQRRERELDRIARPRRRADLTDES